MKRSPQVTIGSQLFLNASSTAAQAREWVRQMAAARLKSIRLFLIWDHLEPRPEQWRFEVYDAVFDEAAACGLWVVPTLMSVSPPGWMRRTGGVQAVANLEDPDILSAADRYLDAVAGRWGGHPALHSWILWNEASRLPPSTPQSRARFRAFLRERFAGDISALNAVQFKTYDDFDQVAAGGEEGSMDLEFAGYAEAVLYQEFAVHDLMRHLRRIRDRLRRTDPEHPVHVNPHNVSSYVQHAGQSVWAEAAEVDFLGCSSHPVWHSTRFSRDRWTRSVGLFADLMRSATPHAEGEFWVTELQGGTTLLSAASADCPDAAELERWMWEGIGSGARATVFWCFNWRDDGYEAGEWHLLQLDGTPSPRLEAATGVARILEEKGDWFGPATPWVPKVVLLRSDAAERLAWVDKTVSDGPEDPRNRSRTADSAAGAALLFADLDLEVGYVEESGLQALVGDETRCPAVIVLPGLECLRDGTLETLLEFQQGGGLVLADGPVGWKDPCGRLAPHRAPLLEKLFGGSLADVVSWREAQRLPDPSQPMSPWWLRVLLTPGTPTSSHWIPTWFFHRFLLGEYPLDRAALRDLLPETLWEGPRLLHPGPATRLRRLRHPQGILLIVLQESGERQVDILFPAAGTLHTLEGNPQTLSANTRLSLPLNDAGVGIFLFSRATDVQQG